MTGELKSFMLFFREQNTTENGEFVRGPTANQPLPQYVFHRFKRNSHCQTNRDLSNSPIVE